MATMSRIFTAIILFMEIQSITSITGQEIRAQMQQQQQTPGSPQIYQQPSNNGPTLIFYDPGYPQNPNPNQYPPPPNTLTFRNDPYQYRPPINVPPSFPQPDIPNVEGPPVFAFNPKFQAPYTPNPNAPGAVPGIPPPPPPRGGPVFNPNQMNPFPNPGANPGAPQNLPPRVYPKGPISRPMPKAAQTPGIIPRPPSDANPPRDPPRDPEPVPIEQGSVSALGSGSGSGSGAESGPIVNAGAGQQVFIEHGQASRDRFIFSTHAQIVLGTIFGFLSLCTLIRCWGKLCWDKSSSGNDEYLQGAAVTRQTTTIEADIDWSDHTENEDDPLDDSDENVMTDIQQMKSRKARELVPDESVESRSFSNADHVIDESLDIGRTDVEILMSGDNNGNKEYPLTDDETKAIMREFKDTDDEYVD